MKTEVKVAGTYRKRWRWSGGKKWRKKEVSLSRLWKTRLFCHITIADPRVPKHRT